MLNFSLYTPTQIVFGKDTEMQIGSLLAPRAKKVLLHYGGGSIQKSGLYDRVVTSLQEAGIAFVPLGGVQPNPRLSLVYEGIDLCRREGIDMILSVGGGSAIDSGKAIAMGVYQDGDIWDAYMERPPVQKALPIATILTIPAAGSESSDRSVITNEALQIKRGHGSHLVRPFLSIINPELFYTLPKAQIGNGVADIMSHIFERYFTNTTNVDLTDGLCEATLRTILKNAPRLMADATDYHAWCEIGFSGTIAHNGLLGMGRAQDWACHGMEHELSAIYDVAHGAGLAVLTPAWMEYVYKDNMHMFMQFAMQVMGVSGSLREPDAIVLEGIARLRAFFDSLGLPRTLSELGIPADKLELMAKKSTGVAYGRTEQPLGGIRKLAWQDVLHIYQMVA